MSAEQKMSAEQTMSAEQKVKFTAFAEDSDLHGVRQVTRSDNGLVSYYYKQLYSC